MKLAAAVLCDAVTIREGLIHVLGGGLSEINRPGLPTPMDAELAIVLETSRDDLRREHKLVAEMQDESEATVLRFEADLSQREVLLRPDEELHVPFASVPLRVSLRGFPLQRSGLYRIVVTLDDDEQRTLWFRLNIVSPPQPAGDPKDQGV